MLKAPGYQGFKQIRNLQAALGDVLTFMEEVWHHFGDIVRLNVFFDEVHFISHPDLVQEALLENKHIYTKTHRKDGKPRGLQLALGDGLLTTVDETKWLRQRRMIQPIFHRRRIASMADKMVEAGQRQLETWRNRPGEIDIGHDMHAITAEIITETMFSAQMSDRIGQVAPALAIGADFTFQRERRPINWPMWLPLPSHLRFRRAVVDADSMIYDAINERRASGEHRDDLLSMLIEAQDEGTGMDDQQLRDELLTIYSAGHETTANALTWTLYLLSEHDAVRQTVLDEIDTVLEGRPPTPDDLPHLPYLRQVMDESMRLYPPVPIFPRQVLDDTKIGGYDIQADSRVLVAIMNIHRHPEFWDAPDEFRPERFAPDNEVKRHRYAYMPFGAGSRLCIGNHFALMEMQLLLALWMQQAEFELIPGQTIDRTLAITLQPSQPMRMRLKWRTPST